MTLPDRLRALGLGALARRLEEHGLSLLCEPVSLELLDGLVRELEARTAEAERLSADLRKLRGSR